MKLRPYQERSISELWSWFASHPEDDPILEASVGAGKSLIIAAIAKRVADESPGARVLVLVHQKELLEQNLDKLLRIWPEADVGVYSASMGKRSLFRQITYATIGSVHKLAARMGRIDVVMCDECFPGNTLVSTPAGSKRIAEVLPGDSVYTATGVGLVRAVSRRDADVIYKVRLSDGTELRTTGNHPVLTNAGWVAAAQLERGAGVVRLQDMPALWQCLSTAQVHEQARGDYLSGHRVVCEGQVLLDLLLKEDGERDVAARHQREDAEHADENRAQAVAAWWKRNRTDEAAAGHAFDAGGWLGCGACCQDWDEEGHRVSDDVQAGLGKRVNDGWHRAGGKHALRRQSGAGQEEGRSAGFVWVESVQAEEQDSTCTVFNLQVSGHPSFFADGFLVHNCHLINPKEIGIWRKFIAELRRYCPQMRVVGLTGTPFRGNGNWLTADKDALFSAIATRVTMRELLDLGYLAPLVSVKTETRIDTDDVKTRGDDYIVADLAKAADKAELVASACDEIVRLAAGRRRWLVFAVTVEHAHHVADALCARGVDAVAVYGDMPKADRAEIIAAYRRGSIRCLVNVAVLTTGFDVPEVDFIALLRATQSLVLYNQVAGRGMRVVGADINESISNGKRDCIWADFTSTTEELGPVDQLKGREPPPKGRGEAPFRICDNCGNRNHASALKCSECGHPFPEPERIKHGSEATGAAVMGSEVDAKRPTYEVTDVLYRIHSKTGMDGLPSKSMRVEYMMGMKCVAREWVLMDHAGFGRRKAEAWWMRRIAQPDIPVPDSTTEAVEWANAGALISPSAIQVSLEGKYPEIIYYDWSRKTYGQQQQTSAGDSHQAAGGPGGGSQAGDGGLAA